MPQESRVVISGVATTIRLQSDKQVFNYDPGYHSGQFVLQTDKQPTENINTDISIDIEPKTRQGAEFRSVGTNSNDLPNGELNLYEYQEIDSVMQKVRYNLLLLRKTTALFVVLNCTLDANNNRIVNLANPIDDTDATNKQYVDTAISSATPDLTPITSSITDIQADIVDMKADILELQNGGGGITYPAQNVQRSNEGYVISFVRDNNTKHVCIPDIGYSRQYDNKDYYVMFAGCNLASGTNMTSIAWYQVACTYKQNSQDARTQISWNLSDVFSSYISDYANLTNIRAIPVSLPALNRFGILLTAKNASLQQIVWLALRDGAGTVAPIPWEVFDVTSTIGSVLPGPVEYFYDEQVVEDSVYISLTYTANGAHRYTILKLATDLWTYTPEIPSTLTIPADGSKILTTSTSSTINPYSIDVIADNHYAFMTTDGNIYYRHPSATSDTLVMVVSNACNFCLTHDGILYTNSLMYNPLTGNTHAQFKQTKLLQKVSSQTSIHANLGVPAGRDSNANVGDVIFAPYYDSAGGTTRKEVGTVCVARLNPNGSTASTGYWQLYIKPYNANNPADFTPFRQLNSTHYTAPMAKGRCHCVNVKSTWIEIRMNTDSSSSYAYSLCARLFDSSLEV